MRSSLLIWPLAAVAYAFNSSEFIPGRYLVEFHDNMSSMAAMENIQSTHLLARPVVEVSSRIFNGASFQLELGQHGDDDHLETLSALPSVKNVWPVREIQLPEHEVHWTGENPASQGGFQNARSTTGFAPHVLTQVDRLHKEGFTGKGIKVGILDGGIDWKHPALGGCFGSGCVVARGYDFVGDDDWNRKPDPDPYTSCNGHGTHVAGIIAAQENKHGFLGVAPGVELGMYRVLGCDRSGSEDIIIAGLLKAFEDGSDIITASLGGLSGWSRSAAGVTLERIVQAGVICTIGGGNAGSQGPFSFYAPGASPEAIGVGSVDNTELPRVFLNATYTVDNGTTKPFGWTQGDPSQWGNVSLPLVVGDYEPKRPGDDCDGFANATELTRKIVLIGTNEGCGIREQVKFALEKGARHVLFYANGTEPWKGVEIPNANETMAVGMVPESTANELVRLGRSGKRVTLNMVDPKFAQQYVDTITAIGGHQISSYSSWGPTWDLDIKPDIMAPGSNILSTYLQSRGGYASASGTSMATPFVAGIVALILEARGKMSPLEMKSLLASTSKPFSTKSLTIFDQNSASSELIPVHQQGSGLIQAWDAVRTTGLFDTIKFRLNDTDHFIGNHNFTVRNTGKEDVTYSVGHKGALTAYTLNPGSNAPVPPKELDLFPRYAEVKLAESTVTVKAGQKSVVSFSVTPPASLSAWRLPIYSGFIVLRGPTGEELSLPYLGVAGSLRSATVLDGVKAQRNDISCKNPNNVATDFTIKRNASSDVLPQALILQPLGSPLVDIQVNSVNGANGSRSIGSVWRYPRRYVHAAPKGFVHVWNGTMADGTNAPAGTYTFVVSAEKIFGEGEKQVVESGAFSISYA